MLNRSKEAEPLPEEPEHCAHCDSSERWVYMGRWGDGGAWFECLECNGLTKERPNEVSD